MIDFYTNIAIHRNEILACGYLDGKRYKHKVRYKPYAFLPSKIPTPYRTLQNTYASKMDFDSISEAREFFDRYKDVDGFKLYGLKNFQYLYIYDNFKGEVAYDASLIQVHNLDIEVAKTDGGTFADISLANGEVTLIGIGIKKQRIIFAHKDYYKPKSKNVLFIKCKDEDDMFRKFLHFWNSEEYRPDVVTGWNVEGFDIPYLINRIRLRLGETEAKKISPWGILRERTIEQWGRWITIFEPVGISVLDYLALYKKFTYSQQESYTLDHIAFVEVGKRKLDYSEYASLDELYEKNFEKYVDYNLADIDRVAEIDAKNKFIELVYAMAYDAKVNYLDALTSVRLWDIIIHNYLMDKGQVIPQDAKTEPAFIPGGYVKEPQTGMHEWVVSFDLQSLYPHLIMQYNISPETLVGFKEWAQADIENVINSQEMPVDIKEKDYCQAANGARFTRKFAGFLPELMKIQFQKRAEYKAKMLELKKAKVKDENEIQKYHNYQLAKKIQLNSAYGALANEWCRWYDWRLASAITLSGQLSVRWVEKAINGFLNYNLGTKDVDYVIAMDTDSCYINLKPYVDRSKITDKQELINYVDSVCEKQLQPIINEAYKKLAHTMNAYENAMFMKREAIADKALWREKKHYIMNVWDNEGVRYDKPQLKIMGIEVVKSIIPQACRDALREAISLIMNTDQATVQEFIKSFRVKFDTLKFDEIAFPRGINGIAKYRHPVTIWSKGTPIHVRAALVYNKMLNDHKLLGKYPKIYDKDKIKFCYLHVSNRVFLSNVIAAPRYLPEEFKIDNLIDRDKMFEKTFLDIIETLLKSVGWSSPVMHDTLESFF